MENLQCGLLERLDWNGCSPKYQRSKRGPAAVVSAPCELWRLRFFCQISSMTGLRCCFRYITIQIKFARALWLHRLGHWEGDAVVPPARFAGWRNVKSGGGGNGE